MGGPRLIRRRRVKRDRSTPGDKQPGPSTLRRAVPDRPACWPGTGHSRQPHDRVPTAGLGAAGPSPTPPGTRLHPGPAWAAAPHSPATRCRMCCGAAPRTGDFGTAGRSTSPSPSPPATGSSAAPGSGVSLGARDGTVVTPTEADAARARNDGPRLRGRGSCCLCRPLLWRLPGVRTPWVLFTAGFHCSYEDPRVCRGSGSPKRHENARVSVMGRIVSVPQNARDVGVTASGDGVPRAGCVLANRYCRGLRGVCARNTLKPCLRHLRR